MHGGAWEPGVGFYFILQDLAISSASLDLKDAAEQLPHVVVLSFFIWNFFAFLRLLPGGLRRERGDTRARVADSAGRQGVRVRLTGKRHRTSGRRVPSTYETIHLYSTK